MSTPETQVMLAEGRTPKRAATFAMQPVSDLSPAGMLAIAVQRGDPLQNIEKLMDLHDRYEKSVAKKAYVEAMAAFKSEPTTILKTKDVNVQGGAKFKHATLADVVDGVVSNLSKYGLSHNWIVETGELIKVKCVVTHKLGHSESTEMSAPPDTGPGRNRIQAVGSTTTYLQRYTLMSLLGLAAKDMDDDGKGADPKPKAKAPDGYDNWSMDLEAIAEEGTARLQEVWKASKEEFKNYAVRHDADWWARVKNKANKVKVTP